MKRFWVALTTRLGWKRWPVGRSVCSEIEHGAWRKVGSETRVRSTNEKTMMSEDAFGSIKFSDRSIPLAFLSRFLVAHRAHGEHTQFRP